MWPTTSAARRCKLKCFRNNPAPSGAPQVSPVHKGWERFPIRATKHRRRGTKFVFLSFAVLTLALVAFATVPEWTRNIRAHSPVESAIFRSVPLPGGEITIRRPPSETVPALTGLIQSEAHPEELYSLRALEEEQALDFTAAESDWKLYLEHSSSKPPAQLALADFYHRRHRPLDEINALATLGSMPALPAEKRLALNEQQSWKAFERIFKVIEEQGLGPAITMAEYKLWVERYPTEQAVYGRYFEFLLAHKNFQAAQELISTYQSRFPEDEIFLTRGRAELAYKQGAVEQGLVVYDRNFQPLWPPELVDNYFDLLTETDNLRHFLERARKTLDQHPDDLNA